MTGQSAEHSRGRLQIDGADLRQRLATVAVAIACTEDQVAETLERLALILPENAVRLRARATQAREHATMERGRAAMFSEPARPAYRSPASPGQPIKQGA